MKKIFTLTSLLFVFLAGNAQSEAKPADVIELKEIEYNFGKIPQGKPVYHFFEVINKGALPLKVDNVLTSCGCTTPEWSKDDVAPGQSTKIKVGYNAASPGPFEKSITINYNGNQTKQIKIKGEVWQAPAGAAPANASVQFLKKQIQ
ncbi:MAG: DUF1573 domain-containing protein [Chitinophagaceae bacterium]